MVDYWFGYYNGEPRTLYRVVTEGNKRYKGEFYNIDEQKWQFSDVIDRYIIFGEPGYEKTTKEEAMKFIESQSA